MAGPSRPKDGVASLAYVPAIPIPLALCHDYRDRRDNPGDDGGVFGDCYAPIRKT
jgi:hypothetical protein